MPANFYPAVIDRSASGFGVSFPDFPGCIAAGDTPNEAAVHAEQALAFHVDAMMKDGDAIPEPSDIAAIEAVDGAEDVARILVRIERPSKVQRVLVSMEENLLRAIDAQTSNRSAFLAEAAKQRLGGVIALAIQGQGEAATMNVDEIADRVADKLGLKSKAKRQPVKPSVDVQERSREAVGRAETIYRDNVEAVRVSQVGERGPHRGKLHAKA